jgi:hypothetical protein
MIELSYKELSATPFIQAMNKINQCTDFKMKVGYKVMMLSKDLQKFFEKAKSEYAAMMEAIAEKENGLFKTHPETKEYIWKDGVDKEDAEKKIEEFQNQKVTVDKPKFNIEDLAPAKLSPADMNSLEPLLHAFEAV